MKFKPSLGNMIIVAVILGVAAGIFFGEDCAKLGVIGNAFIALLQMCVLPYILFSMIHGIGSLSYKEARMLAVKGGILMLIFWAIAFIFILLMPVCFPRGSQRHFLVPVLLLQPKKWIISDFIFHQILLIRLPTTWFPLLPYLVYLSG